MLDGYIQESDYFPGHFYVGDTGRNTAHALEEMRKKVLAYVSDDARPYTVEFTVKVGFTEGAPATDQTVIRTGEVGIQPAWMNIASSPDLPEVPESNVTMEAKGLIFSRSGDFFMTKPDNSEIDLIGRMNATLVRSLQPFMPYKRSLYVELSLAVGQSKKQVAADA